MESLIGIHRLRLFSRLGRIMALALIGGLVWPIPAQAVTVRHVSPTGTDVGDCWVNPCKTIGYAITQSASGDTIRIAAGTYAEHVVVDRSVTLAGAGSRSTFVDGSYTGRVVVIGAASRSITVTLTGLTIKKGTASIGGGIWSAPGDGQTNQVLLVRVVITGNIATSSPVSPLGGGVANGAGSTLKLLHGAVMDNLATGPAHAYAGGVYNEGTLLVAGSAITGNSALAGARSVAYGGGINNQATLVVTRSTISGNVAQGGHSGLVCFPPRCHPAPGGPGKGGGISVGAGTATVDHTTISGNRAIGGAPGPGAGGDGAGGGIEGPVTLVNSTVSENAATGGGGEPGLGRGFGGGIDAFAPVIAVNSTIAGNSASAGPGSGGGIDITVGSATLTNTILAGNTVDAGGSGPDCLGTASSGGHNLLGSIAGCAGFTGQGDLVDVDPILGPLRGNGGPTFTMALLSGSPAIDAADDGVCAAPPVNGKDQRGVSRPQGPHCDMGAYEGSS